MASSPLFDGSARTEQTLFVPGFAQRPRVLWSAGSLGSRITNINLASGDAGAQTPQFYVGKPLTLADNMGTGALVDNGASADTITRTEGSFLTDGWQVGDRAFVQDPTTLANGFQVLLTAAAALTLSLATGGGTIDTAENLPSGAKLLRLTALHSLSLAAAAGFSGNVAVSGLDDAQLPGLNAGVNRELVLGPDTLLLAALSATLGAGETVDVTLFGYDF